MRERGEYIMQQHFRISSSYGIIHREHLAMLDTLKRGMSARLTRVFSFWERKKRNEREKNKKTRKLLPFCKRAIEYRGFCVLRDFLATYFNNDGDQCAVRTNAWMFDPIWKSWDTMIKNGEDRLRVRRK